MQSDTTQKSDQKDWSQHKFVTPKKDLSVIEQMETFKKGKSYVNYMQFVADLQQSVTSKKISETPADPKFENIVKMLEDLERWVAEIPPIQQPMRFGNKSFKTWHDRLKEVKIFLEKESPLIISKNVDEYLAKILPENVRGATVELRVYILESFGSNERLDYGTGIFPS
jgi:serine/threonine-protein phosphatase 2A activator